MKEPLKAPFIFLFILLCSVAVLATLQVMAGWGLMDSPTLPFSLTYFLQRFPRAVEDVMIPAVMIAIVLLGFRMARHPFSRFLGMLIVLAVSYVCLVNGMLWFRSLARVSVTSAEVPRQYLSPATFTRVGDATVAVSELAGTGVRDILRVDAARQGSRFTVYGAGIAASRGGTLSITTAGPAPMTIAGPADLSWTTVFAPDRFTSVFLRDIGTVTTDFERLMARSLPEFFAACLALVFLSSTSLVLLRITRWPLANVMLLVIATRGIFSLYHLLAVRLAPQIGQVVTDSLVARMAAPAAFAVIGVVFLLIDILFVPADRWSAPEAA